MRVGVIVVNYNLPLETARCVESILAGTVSPAAVVVVDNGSDPEARQKLRERLAAVEVLTAGRNAGFAAACNLALKPLLARDVDWVWLVNNDAVAEPEALERLLEAARGLPDAGILSPLIRRPPDGAVWHQGAVEAGGLRPVPRDLRTLSLEPAIRVDYVTGCAMLVRRQVFEAVGPFDEDFFMYYEELDFCRRARAAGFGIYVVPTATVWHEVGATGRLVPAVSRFHRARSRIRFYRRGGGRWRLAVPLVVVSTLGWAVTSLVRGDLGGAASTLRGVWAGLWADLRPNYGPWASPGSS